MWQILDFRAEIGTDSAWMGLSLFWFFAFCVSECSLHWLRLLAPFEQFEEHKMYLVFRLDRQRVQIKSYLKSLVSQATLFKEMKVKNFRPLKTNFPCSKSFFEYLYHHKSLKKLINIVFVAGRYQSWPTLPLRVRYQLANILPCGSDPSTCSNISGSNGMQNKNCLEHLLNLTSTT